MQQAVFNLCGAKRRMGTDVLVLPEEWNLHQRVETWLTFRTEDTQVCTDSVYVGSVGM